MTLSIDGLNSEREKRNVTYHYECGLSTQTNPSLTLGSSKATYGAWPWVGVCSIDIVHCNTKWFVKEFLESSGKNTW